MSARPERAGRRPSVARAAERHFGRPWVGHAFIGFLVVCALAGGASRIDSTAQPIVQLASVAMIALALAVTPPRRFAEIAWPLAFAGACVALVALQLVPLPPDLWTALPGREFYARGAELAGIGQPWRPISLSPDLTWASFAGLLPPLAALLGLFAAGRARTPSYLTVLLLIVLFSAGLGLAQLGAGPESGLRFYAITNNEAPVGLFANRNHQALLIALAVPMAAAWARLHQGREVRISPRWLAIGVALALIPIMLLTGSRSGMALTAVGLVPAAAFLYARGRSSRRPRLRPLRDVLLPAGLIVLVTVLSVLLSRAVALDRLLGADWGSENRLRVVEPALRMAGEYFPVGSGFGTFDPAFRRFEPFEMLSSSYMNQAHSDLLQLVIEAGAFGLALLLVYLVWWGRRTIALWRAAPDRAAPPLLGRLGSVATGMILLSSLAEYPLRTPFFAVLFVIASVWMMIDRAAAGTGDRRESAN